MIDSPAPVAALGQNGWRVCTGIRTKALSEVQTLLQSGVKAQDVARRYGVARSTLYQHLRR